MAIFVVLVIFCSWSGRTAAALDIELSFSGGFENRAAAVAAMNQAAAAWERVLSDPVVVEIHVREASFFELPFGADGGAFPTWYEWDYASVRETLIADATSADDAVAVAHLPPGPGLSFRAWDGQRQVVTHQGDDWIDNSIAFATRPKAPRCPT